MDVEITDDVGRFAETYSSFNKIINKLQRQYISLKETYSRQSEELQTVNQSLQSAMKENRAVTEFLNSILNSLESGVIAVDRNGFISHMNPAAYKILGLGDGENRSIKARYDEIIKPVENGDFSAVKAIELAAGLPSGEKKIITEYGTILTLSVSISVLMNRGGEIVGAVEMFHDISKMKAMEEQISQMKVLASLGEMAASIAHEIRNPLVGVGGFASLLARDLDDDPKKKDMARKIVEGVESINLIIQNLLDFARKEKINKSKVDLNSYMKLAFDNFAAEYGFDDLEKRLTIDLPSRPTIPVELDRQLFKQAVCNIVKNGLEVGSKGRPTNVSLKSTLLPVETAHKEYHKRLELSGTETLAEIVIQDDGPGIDRDSLDKLFSPFFTTKENGIGLGLSIAWKIIKAHGGDISAESVEGKGTRFSIILPVKTI